LSCQPSIKDRNSDLAKPIPHKMAEILDYLFFSAIIPCSVRQIISRDPTCLKFLVDGNGGQQSSGILLLFHYILHGIGHGSLESQVQGAVMLVVIIPEQPPGEQLHHDVVRPFLHFPLVFEARVPYALLGRPAKILEVETQDDPRLVHQAMPAMICPQTTVKVVGGYGTSVAHVLAMDFDDPSMDDDLCRILNAHEIVSDGEWSDIW
jgi:hypothetical protein